MDGKVKRPIIAALNVILLFFAYDISPRVYPDQWGLMGLSDNAVFIIVISCAIMIFVNTIYLTINIKRWKIKAILAYRFNYFVMAVIILSIARLIYIYNIGMFDSIG